MLNSVLWSGNTVNKTKTLILNVGTKCMSNCTETWTLDGFQENELLARLMDF